MPASTLIPLGGDLFLTQGRPQILNLAPALQELSNRTRQLGAMHWLEYFLYTASPASKPPHLVLQLRCPSRPDSLDAENILAAALFFEYRFAGLATGVFCTDDAVGFRTVIAAREERSRFAERAANALLRRGAHVVLTTYESPNDTEAVPRALPGTLLGYRQRSVGRMLTLAPNYEEMLSNLGRLTRRNFRYYRRRLASRVQLNFVADARAELSFGQFMRLNSGSRNPVRSERELWLRWRNACRGEGGFLQGLRLADGKWLALLGGWRHETTTVLHWQLNGAGYERDSIGIVMRSFFLEHEIGLGARKLLMYGGTPHSIRYSFDQDVITDLFLCRLSARSLMLRLLAKPLTQFTRLGRTNQLLQTLADLRLHAYKPLAETPIEQTSAETSQAA